MPARQYDIFISYRRDGGFATANHLYDLLSQDGYAVSFDLDTLREGDFDTTLLERIERCTDFVLIVDEHTFDRTVDPNFNPANDWLRRELAHALRQHKNVIPIRLTGFDGFPDNLPPDIAAVATKNGPEYNKYYFDEFYKRLKTFLHSKPQAASQGKRTRLAVTAACVMAILLLAGSLYAFHDKLTGNSAPEVLAVTDSICINPVLGEFHYTGPVDQQGLPHGKGLAKFAQGDTYDGYFDHGTFDGQCTYLNYREGDRFVGTYRDNARYEGTYVWKDGTYFTDTFKDNEVCVGTLYDINGNVLQEYTESDH